MAKTIGIDLGTTNSCMAVLEGGEPTVIPNAEGGRTTPSVVAFTKDGQRLVGAPARRQQVTNPQNTISSIKRFMGRKWEEVSDEMTIVPYEVVQGENGDARVVADDKQFAPPEISAMILQKLKTDAEAFLGDLAEPARLSEVANALTADDPAKLLSLTPLIERLDAEARSRRQGGGVARHRQGHRREQASLQTRLTVRQNGEPAVALASPRLPGVW